MKSIFVFGSNLGGRHGKGSALEALKNYGAIYGQGEGLQGNSYAIPTKDKNLKVLTLNEIAIYVNRFIEFAKQNSDMQFNLVKIGCGLAGYKEEEIAPFFREAIQYNNINLPDGWLKIIQNDILDEITKIDEELKSTDNNSDFFFDGGSRGGTYLEEYI